MKFFHLDFLNRMSCKNRNGVMLVNIFLKIFWQFFEKIECSFKSKTSLRSCILVLNIISDLA